MYTAQWFTNYRLYFTYACCVCMLIQFSCLIATPWTVAHQAPVYGILQEEYWSGLPCPPSGDVPHLGIEHASPAFQVGSLPLSHRVSPILLILIIKYWLYSSCCTTLRCNLFVHSSLYLLLLGNHQFVLHSASLFLFCYIH